MSFEGNFNWIYTFLIIPLGLLFQRHFSVSSRVTVLENNDEAQEKRIDRVCDSNDDLTKEVHEMIGRWDEYLRKNG